MPPFAVNPHPKDTFAIGPTDKVATGGSCFAQRVAEAVQRTHPPVVDVSSGVESAPGVKDPARIRAFITHARAVAHA